MPYRNVCVFGGGGFLGRHLVNRLIARGCKVRVPTRRLERVKALWVLPDVEAIEADIHDPEQLGKLLQGMDAAINLVGILHGNPKDFVRVHVKLPHKLLEACRRHGVRRLLHVSALGADPASRSFYQHSKGEGERLLMEPSRRRDIDITVFRPSVIFGPDDSFLNLFARLMRFSPVLPLANAKARFQPVYVGDVARAIDQCLDDPETFGQSYNLCGPKVYTLAELVTLIARTLGLRRVILKLDKQASYALAWLMEHMPGPKLMTRDNHYAMQVDNVCAEGFPERFGAPTTLESVLEDWIEDGPHRGYHAFRARAHR